MASRLAQPTGIALAHLIVVHHVTPLAFIGKAYRVDPAKDLCSTLRKLPLARPSEQPAVFFVEEIGTIRARKSSGPGADAKERRRAQLWCAVWIFARTVREPADGWEGEALPPGTFSVLELPARSGGVPAERDWPWRLALGRARSPCRVQ